MGDTLKTTIQTKQDLYTNSYKITINWGTIQVLEKVFYTKVSRIRRLTLVQEATPVAVEVSAPTTLVGSIMAPLFVVVAPLLRTSMVTTSASVAPPPYSSAPIVPPSTIVALTSTFSHPRVSLDHIYTSHDVDSLWGMGTNLNKRPWLTLYRPLIKILSGQPGSSMPRILPRSFFNGVWQSLKKMGSNIKRHQGKCHFWRLKMPNGGQLLALFGEWSTLR